MQQTEESRAKEYRRRYYEANKEKAIIASHQRYIENREQLLQYQRDYRKKNRALVTKKAKDKRQAKLLFLIDYLGGVCNSCCISYPSCVYDFHHRDPSEKSFTIGEQMGKSLTGLKLEADKCDLLCANCHRVLHSKDTKDTI
jgi:hypothetical protein